MKLPSVRQAVPEDFPEAMRLMRLAYEENGTAEVDWGAVEGVVVAAINGDGAALGVVDGDGDLRGLVLLRLCEVWYSREIMLEELVAFVPREHRRQHCARALLEFARGCSDRLGVPLLIGVISNERTGAKVRLYRRVFGEPSGAFFLYGRGTGRPGGC